MSSYSTRNRRRGTQQSSDPDCKDTNLPIETSKFHQFSSSENDNYTNRLGYDSGCFVPTSLPSKKHEPSVRSIPHEQLSNAQPHSTSLWESFNGFGNRVKENSQAKNNRNCGIGDVSLGNYYNQPNPPVSELFPQLTQKKSYRNTNNTSLIAIPYRKCYTPMEEKVVGLINKVQMNKICQKEITSFLQKCSSISQKQLFNRHFVGGVIAFSQLLCKVYNQRESLQQKQTHSHSQKKTHGQSQGQRQSQGQSQGQSHGEGQEQGQKQRKNQGTQGNQGNQGNQGTQGKCKGGEQGRALNEEAKGESMESCLENTKENSQKIQSKYKSFNSCASFKSEKNKPLKKFDSFSYMREPLSQEILKRVACLPQEIIEKIQKQLDQGFVGVQIRKEKSGKKSEIVRKIFKILKKKQKNTERRILQQQALKKADWLIENRINNLKVLYQCLGESA